MATVVSRLEAVLTAQTKDFERAMDKSEHRMSGVGKAAAVAGTAILTGLGYGLDKSVHAAMAAQVSQTRLEQAFKSAHLSAGKYEKQITAVEAKSRKVGFSNEQVRSSLGSLITATQSYTKSQKELTIVEDLARYKHISLEQATKALTMASAGSTRFIKQLGILTPTVTAAQDKLKDSYARSVVALKDHYDSLGKLTDAQKQQYEQQKLNLLGNKNMEMATARLTDKHATIAKAMEIVSQKVHGQADAYSKTAAGAMEAFHAQLENLEVKMGTGLLPVMAKVATALSTLVDWFSKHNTVAKVTITVVGALGAAFLLASVYAKVMASALVTRVIPAIVRTTAVQLALNFALIANPIGVVIIALAALGVAMVVAYYKVKFFREGVQATFRWIKENWPLLVGIIGGPIGLALEQIITKRNRIAAAFQALPGMIGNAIGGAMHFLKDKLFEVFDPGKIKNWILEALHFKSPSPFFVDIGKQIITSIAHGVGAYAGILKHAVFGLAKSIPGKALGALGGAAHAVLGSGGNQRPVYGSGGLVPQVANAVSYARQHGWHGTVTSGYRTYAEQARLYDNYLHHGGPLAAKPGTSSHETGQAVDVTDYVTFGRIMAHAPSFERLYNRLGAADPVHYSVSGYAKGGLVPGPIGMPQLAVVHGGETVTPPGRGGNTYNSFSFPNYIGSQNELAGQIFDVLQAYESRNGRSPGSGF